MHKNVARKLAFLVFLALLASPVERAFASSTGQPPTYSSGSTTSQPTPADGITGTDPEPIEPNVVSLVLTLLHLS